MRFKRFAGGAQDQIDAGPPGSPMEKAFLPSVTESGQDPLPFSNTLVAQQTTRSKAEPRLLRQPWRHSITRAGLPFPSQTVREFKPERQRQRLFLVGIWQWFITFGLCGLLAACLGGFSRLLVMTIAEVKAFNALIVLISLLLGNNLTGSLREYALMLRWRVLASKYRSLHEFDLILRCDSLRKVIKLFWVARTPGAPWFWLSRTQWVCALWIAINILLQVLVALLGLTYNLEVANIPQLKFGQISVADLSIVRDVWGAESPSFDAQLGSANSFGIQGQDYNFVNEVVPPGQGKIPSYGTPTTPTIFGNEDWSVMTYFFQDRSVYNPELTLISHRNISVTASCKTMQLLAGGNGTDKYVTYVDEDGSPVILNVVRVGPGAMTYVGVLNSTCGPRCSEVMALQSAGVEEIPTPSFYKCRNTLTPVEGVEEYLFDGQSPDAFELADQQARILAGAIGWSGFNFTAGDQYQYVRYNTESYWSPNDPADASRIAGRIGEFAIEAVAAIDYNGARRNVSGWYPVAAQAVAIQWQWSASILGLLPFFQLLALVCVISRANSAIIRDDSSLSTARLLRPIVEKLADGGCMLTGQEIADELADMKVKYGWRETGPAFVFENTLEDDSVRHLDILEEQEGLGLQGTMPSGRYDGLWPDGSPRSPSDRGRGRLRQRDVDKKRAASL
jgi:hypothetical protein